MPRVTQDNDNILYGRELLHISEEQLHGIRRRAEGEIDAEDISALSYVSRTHATPHARHVTFTASLAWHL